MGLEVMSNKIHGITIYTTTEDVNFVIKGLATPRRQRVALAIERVP